jgi:hypothetical protein
MRVINEIHIYVSKQVVLPRNYFNVKLEEGGICFELLGYGGQ